MKITNIHLSEDEDLVRLQAEVIWEDVKRPTDTVFFEADRRFKTWFKADANAFLAASILPAWYLGERRLLIEGQPVCPVLRDGLACSMTFLSKWYGQQNSQPIIESSVGFMTQDSEPTPHASLFLSCGVDSLATLRLNRLYFPALHVRSFKSAILINYLGFGLSAKETASRFRERQARASAVCHESGLEFIPITTNVRCLEPDMGFWMKVYHGAVLASTAIALSGRLTHISIASSDDARNLAPWGSHPLLDPNYSTSYLEVEHHGLKFSRLEKTAIIADWSLGLKSVHVCINPKSGGINCCKCEKCIRTMAALAALGKLTECSAFNRNDLATEDFENIRIVDPYIAECYAELLPHLTNRDRHDLASIISSKLGRSEK